MLKLTKFNRLKDCVVTNKNVILRVDINVPIIEKRIEDDTRIKAVIPTIEYLVKNNAKVIVISHFGRPDGKRDESMSLKQLMPRLQELLSLTKFHFVDDCIGSKVKDVINKANFGEVVVLENLRFYKQETKNDHSFSQELSSLANLYVNDAFSCSHRSHSSITGIPAILKSCAGFLMEKELDNLTNLLENAKKPMMAVVGGAKVSTKIDLINSLSKKAQTIVVGGGMANSFLYAMGKKVGNSLCEKELKDEALKILKNVQKSNCKIILPIDLVVSKKFEKDAVSRNITLDQIEADDIILDIGIKTSELLEKELNKHQTVLWNGPLGAFEIKPFNRGTVNFAKSIAELTRKGVLTSIAGGGDVVSAINSCNLFNEFSYISTAGGAFLEWLEDKELPGVKALYNQAI
jgi:phosphoglycerate kinase